MKNLVISFPLMIQLYVLVIHLPVQLHRLYNSGQLLSMRSIKIITNSHAKLGDVIKLVGVCKNFQSHRWKN